MKTSLATFLVLFVCLAVPVSAAPPPPAELATIEKTLIARWNTVNSLTGTVSGTASIAACFPQLPLQGAINGNGSLAFLRKSGKELARVDLTADIGEGARIGRIMALMNGTHAFIVTELLGTTKTEEADPATPENGAAVPGGATLFQGLHAHCKVAAKGRQALGGKDTYVIEARPRNAADAGPLALVRLFMDPDTGLVIKSVGFDAQGAVLAALNVSNVKINVPVSAELFAGAPPAPTQGMTVPPSVAAAAESTRAGLGSARAGLEELTNQVKERLAR